MLKIYDTEMKTLQEDDGRVQEILDLIKLNSTMLNCEIEFSIKEEYTFKHQSNRMLTWVIKDPNFVIRLFFKLSNDMELLDIYTTLYCGDLGIDIDIEELEKPRAQYIGLSVVKNFIDNYVPPNS